MSFDVVTFLEGLYQADSALRKGLSEMAPPTVNVDDLPGDWRMWFEERAAIIEYHGGLSREYAEAEALKEAVALMRQG